MKNQKLDKDENWTYLLAALAFIILLAIIF